jgi:hypothetical protein
MYAQKTKVTVDRTKTEIEQTLIRYGASRFAYFVEPGSAAVVFEAHDRRLRFDLPVPKGETERDRQLQRQRWRALLLCIKAKLESVASKIETFEEAFLAHVVMPDGGTVYQHTQARIEASYQGGHIGPLLPPPTRKAAEP